MTALRRRDESDTIHSRARSSPAARLCRGPAPCPRVVGADSGRRIAP